MARITRKMIISKVIKDYPGSMAVFETHDMNCPHCMASDNETIEGGARMHGVDVELLLHDLNDRLPPGNGKNS